MADPAPRSSAAEGRRAAAGETPFVSTGDLPAPDEVERLLAHAHERFASHDEGTVSDAYGALAEVDDGLFGISVAATTGGIFEVGDTTKPFTVMSIAKPFIFALVCDRIGPDEARAKLGANATGLPFNSIAALERSRDGTTNPMVNPGAIAATSLVPGTSAEDSWRFVHEGLSAFAGHRLALDERVYSAAADSNNRNRAIAQLLESLGRLYADPLEAVDTYTRACSLQVTSTDLAVMGATLAGGGVNPLTGERVVEGPTCHYTLAVMTTAGMYEDSGDWLYDVGLPAKSGIAGGIVTVSPGKGGLGTFSPRLDRAGNSVRGQLVAACLAQELGLDVFLSDRAR